MSIEQQFTFSNFDYWIFWIMIGISGLIGLYYGFLAKRKQNTANEYLLGGKNMKVWPVAISLTATHISATTLIGVPAEIYKYGSQYWICTISAVILMFSLLYIYLPVFYDLQTVSCYSYLERRFDVRIRRFASFLFFLYVIIVSPLYVYTPALAFSQATGIHLHVVTPVICGVCIFYTMFGGLRAVVWTDTLQFSSMIGAVLVVIVLGTIKAGGILEVFKIADKSGRLIWFNLDPNPLVRSSVWTVTIGMTTMWISNVGVTQECIQRFVSMPTLADAKRAIFIFSIGHLMIKLLSVYNGLLIFSNYEKCDPIFDKKVHKYDQIFPYYVMDIARSVPGIPGLFIVGVLSAALSSFSSCLNSLSATAYEDFIKPCVPNLTDFQANKIMKSLVLIMGLVCIGLVFIIERLGSIFNIAIAFSGITSGAMLGLFTMGMLSRKFNATGALWGSISSLIVVGIVFFGAQIYTFQGKLKYPSLPFNTEECHNGFHGNVTNNLFIADEYDDALSVPWIFRINFMYYSLLGTIMVALIGYPISILSGGNNSNFDEKLLAPLARKSVLKNHKEQTEIEIRKFNEN